jgi:hypothetical protein
MSRIVMPRCLAVLTLVVGLCLLSPVCRAAGSSHPQPATPAPAAAAHADAVATLRSWLAAVLAKLPLGSGGKPAGTDGGICIDPNGGCT